MANEEQLSILKQGVHVWNEWRAKNQSENDNLGGVDLSGANLEGADLENIDLFAAKLEGANLGRAHLSRADLRLADFSKANLRSAELMAADLSAAKLHNVSLYDAYLDSANLSRTSLAEADLTISSLTETNFNGAHLNNTIFSESMMGSTILGDLDLGQAIGLDKVDHSGPSSISTNTFIFSKGKIPTAFLRGCGLSDWEIEQVKLYNPDLDNAEIANIQYKMYDLRATRALQVSLLFISYSRADDEFVDKVGNRLATKGIRYWRDIHDMKAGKLEKQIDHAIRQNPTLLLVLSEHSLSSDWVEHEVRTARGLERETERDVLCPIALDDSLKSSRWPKRLMEQIMEYNILDFSDWKDDSKFEGMFRKLIDGLELFYKG